MIVNKRLSKDFQFLIACCQATPSPEDIKFIRSFLNQQHSMLDTLIQLANQHGILPLVYYNIKTHTIDLEIQKFLPDLKQNYLAIAQRNILMSAELIRIMKLFKDNGIKALAFKGPTLSQMLYGDITLRQFGDLDILLKEKDIYDAANILINSGFINLNPLKMLNNDTCLDVAKDFHILNPNGNIHIELHWKLFEKKHKINLSNLNAKDINQIIYINKKEISTLSNEVLLVYLCIHGSKHMWERIEWICDIDRLILSQNINWEEVIQIAEQLNSTKAFFLGLKLSNIFFLTPIPEEIHNSINKKEVNVLFDMTIQQFSENKNTESTMMSSLLKILKYQSLLFDSKQNSYALYFHTLFKISRGDCENFRLPKQINFLYIILRPFRLIRKHVFFESRKGTD